MFQTYFSVLKRMPNAALLEPVLEGLSKYAHLLNVEFFEDIVFTMEELIEKRVNIGVVLTFIQILANFDVLITVSFIKV